MRRIVLAYILLVIGAASLLFCPDPQAFQARLRLSFLENCSPSRRPDRSVTLRDQIAAATGLQIGQTVSEDDFKIVSQHLGETGAFSNVAYTFEFSPGA